MAPNLDGVAVADAARMSDLAELAVDFAVHHLTPQGALLVKCFHGSGYSQLVELSSLNSSGCTCASPRPTGRSPRKPICWLGV
jgi:23S rRNA U2552 (ribose-2'-O)-methylase RlmE/FtsJ